MERFSPSNGWMLIAKTRAIRRLKGLVYAGTGLGAASIAVLVVALTFTREPVAGQSPLSPVTIPRYANPRDGWYSGSRTAIYDIAMRTVYLPDGHRLEAHSGFGIYLDDPRFIKVKGQGPTPPNVYNLILRERPFHGVLAIRLIPVDPAKMYGRDGLLAHSYLRGSNGQSNGCVVFHNYPAFLNAFLGGEVNRLVVVDHLPTTTSAGVRGYVTY
jgi:hypothetical protein